MGGTSSCAVRMLGVVGTPDTADLLRDHYVHDPELGRHAIERSTPSIHALNSDPLGYPPLSGPSLPHSDLSGPTRYGAGGFLPCPHGGRVRVETGASAAWVPRDLYR